MRSQVEDAGDELAQLQDLLDRASRRGDALEIELGHARADLARTDTHLDRIGTALAAARSEAEQLKLAAADQLRDAEAAVARIAGLNAALTARDATIEAMSRLLGQRGRELADLHGQVALQSGAHSAAAGASEARAEPSQNGAQNAGLQRRLRNAEEDAALQRALVNLLQGMLQILASPGRWWNAFLPGFWVRRLKYDRLRRKGLFDAAHYAKRYPDVGRAGTDPLHHYVSHGLEEGRTRM